MTQPTGLRTRIERLEEGSAVSGVAGITTARGGPYDAEEQARARQQVAELQRAGYQVVYFANLAGRSLANRQNPVPQEASEQGI